MGSGFGARKRKAWRNPKELDEVGVWGTRCTGGTGGAVDMIWSNKSCASSPRWVVTGNILEYLGYLSYVWRLRNSLLVVTNWYKFFSMRGRCNMSFHWFVSPHSGVLGTMNQYEDPTFGNG